ncbi:ParB family protein [Cellvibrio sp. QJXJ]|uniref:ParB family protein n=1 Tax=Cellvibrio sp. QJXJ TaxID=2964606 RepID=UPI0021C35AC5|nr:ParB family protein [Cellvibrio sp. QJXJ]UUA74213.1 hypothetical protein NNX04_07175 [Cellvibrio sp. QJXJ]
MSKSSIADRLNKPHLSASPSDGSPLPPDPVVKTRVRVNLDNTIAYRRNPRRTRNPRYDEIKESIRNAGLDHPPVVTRESPADPYMIKKGGNTRLSILRELWQETGDRKYYEFDCDFEPWTSDFKNLISHMIENEMKGDTLFIERALAAYDLKLELEAEKGELSTRELARLITAEGWTLKDTSLNQMLYAHENLFPIIPEAFWSGIGIDRVKKIRKLLETCKTFWESVAQEHEGTFDDIWKPVFTAMDGDGFDIDKAEHELCSAMSAKLDSPVLQLRAEVQAIGVGISKGGNRPRDIIAEANAQEQLQKQTGTNTTKAPQPPKRPPELSPSNPGSSQETDSSLQTEHEQENQEPVNNSPAVVRHVYGDLSSLQYLLDYEVSSLKELAYQAAVDYADTVGLSEYVDYLEEDGWHTGYRMLPPSQIDSELILYWVTLWAQSHALTAPISLFNAMNELLEVCPSISKDNLLTLLALGSAFKGRLMGRQISDPDANPIQWQALTELEAIVSLLVDYRTHSPHKLNSTVEVGGE